MPYRTFETDKGGNAALMAPEVVTAMPGTFTNINYTKVIETVLRNQIRLVLHLFIFWNPDWSTLNRDKQGWGVEFFSSETDPAQLKKAYPDPT